ncbi:ABC transporter permease [Actinobacteria bacterium YIM 96077]|uniref:ABC transporter permease n=1 Tax=Phytoactinopolyspora halophila TaxID=1981511 RepID=A0A329R6R7_9ACTN|nr:ABC transporter permease [Phytoactinopolyspora halophila]AYY12028.1 ABC transporter permease [Actinobacteria bacterium YIM 96077]RAW18738.1 ABC transporter permease [Phytoactinopolyspora halophila]
MGDAAARTKRTSPGRAGGPHETSAPADAAQRTGETAADEHGWIDAGRPWTRARRSRLRLSARQRLAVGIGVVIALVAYAVAVPIVAGFDERAVDLSASGMPPSWAQPFGTDMAGRDLFVRAAAGLRISLLIAGTCAILSTVLGVLVGVLAGGLGRWVDRIVMRLVDTVNAIPHLLLGIVIVALYRGNVIAIVASITLTHWAPVARLIRSEVLSLRQREFVDAAISGGAGRIWVIRRHFVPAIVPQAVVAAALLLPHAVWHESALSFLGLGLPPHRASLGTLLDEARESLLLGSWWTLVFPSLMLVAATLAIAACGAAWRDHVLPRRRSEELP